MKNSVLKIGEVIEVRGQKIRARIFNEKNTSSIIFDGEIIRNVSVGSYIKITKGYSTIIGRIEGEYISENDNARGDYKKKNEKIIRIIEISIVGTFNSMFKHGISEMPLVGNEIYILTEEEIQGVFTFAKAKDNSITLGKIMGYSDYMLDIDIDKIFASHIGIFGNTGSGKSNTLVYLYTKLFEKYCIKSSFNRKSKFVFLDFNGEFKNTFIDNKKYYNLSTRISDLDKYPINKDFILDDEFWSIITEATSKTQVPFISRSLRTLDRHYSNNEIDKHEVCSKVKTLIENLFENPERFNQLKRSIIDLIFSGFNVRGINISDHLGRLGYHIKNNVYYIPEGNKEYYNSQEQFNKYMEPVIELLTEDNIKFDSNNLLEVFKFFVLYQYVKEVFIGISNEEHIAPLLKRFNQRYEEVDKVFRVLNEEEETDSKNIEIISLADVNIRMRKTIPLLICKQSYEKQKSQFASNTSLHIIIDEAHNILSSTSERESSVWKDYRLEVFEEIIKEGRKFGVFLTIASQRPSDISATLVSQLHNYYLHRLVNNEDIRAIGKTISFLDGASHDMIPILPQGACILTGTAMNFPIVVQMNLLPNSRQPDSSTITLSSIWRD